MWLYDARTRSCGKIKEKFLKAGIDEFLKRLTPYATIDIIELTPIEIKEDSLIKKTLEQEGEKILSNIMILDRFFIKGLIDDTYNFKIHIEVDEQENILSVNYELNKNV